MLHGPPATPRNIDGLSSRPLPQGYSQPCERTAGRAVLKSYRPGQIVPRLDHDADHRWEHDGGAEHAPRSRRPDAGGGGLPVVETGLVALTLRHRDGRRHIIFLACPGDVLWAPGSALASAEAEALTESTVRCHAQAQLDVDEHLRQRLFAQIRRQHERSLQHVFALGQREARHRLGWFLASFAGGRREVDLPMSRQDIADYLGITIETVSREFTRLKRLGAVAYSRNGSVAILRPDALAIHAD